jgi:hypothetical protein
VQRVCVVCVVQESIWVCSVLRSVKELYMDLADSDWFASHILEPEMCEVRTASVSKSFKQPCYMRLYVYSVLGLGILANSVHSSDTHGKVTFALLELGGRMVKMMMTVYIYCTR